MWAEMLPDNVQFSLASLPVVGTTGSGVTLELQEAIQSLTFS